MKTLNHFNPNGFTHLAPAFSLGPGRGTFTTGPPARPGHGPLGLRQDGPGAAAGAGAEGHVAGTSVEPVAVQNCVFFLRSNRVEL